MSKEKSGDSNEKISANDPDYVNPFTGERPNRKSPSPDIDHLTVNQMKSIFDENGIKYKKSGNKGQLKDVLKQNYKDINQSTIPAPKARTTQKRTKKSKEPTLTALVEEIAEKEADQMLDGIEGTIEQETCSPGKRRNVDYNFFELVFGICALDKEHKIKNKDDIKNVKFEDIKEQLIGCNENCFNRYMKDGNKDTATPKLVLNHINKMREDFHLYVPGGFNEVKCIYLEGKNLTTQKLKDLNKGFDTKKAKADVYVETNDGTIVGFSLKQDQNCTMTNYSTEAMLSSLFDKKVGDELQEELKQARLKILSDIGINDMKTYKQIRDELDSITGKKRKPQDNRINKLFFDGLEGTNIYWEALKGYINKNAERISREIVGNMFPVNLKYNLYQFDGSEYMQLNVPTTIQEFKDHVRFYFDPPTKAEIKKGMTENKRKHAAKLFYKLVVNGRHYRMEIRFKNPILSSASQFFVHKDHQRTPSPESGKASKGGTRKRRKH